MLDRSGNTLIEDEPEKSHMWFCLWHGRNASLKLDAALEMTGDQSVLSQCKVWCDGLPDALHTCWHLSPTYFGWRKQGYKVDSSEIYWRERGKKGIKQYEAFQTSATVLGYFLLCLTNSKSICCWKHVWKLWECIMTVRGFWAFLLHSVNSSCILVILALFLSALIQNVSDSPSWISSTR